MLGRGNVRWEGNQRFQELAKQYAPRYLGATTRAAKARIVSEIIQTVQDSGGRFLDRSCFYDNNASSSSSTINNINNHANHISNNNIEQRNSTHSPTSTIEKAAVAEPDHDSSRIDSTKAVAPTPAAHNWAKRTADASARIKSPDQQQEVEEQEHHAEEKYEHNSKNNQHEEQEQASSSSSSSSWVLANPVQVRKKVGQALRYHLLSEQSNPPIAAGFENQACIATPLLLPSLVQQQLQQQLFGPLDSISQQPDLGLFRQYQQKQQEQTHESSKKWHGISSALLPGKPEQSTQTGKRISSPSTTLQSTVASYSNSDVPNPLLCSTNGQPETKKRKLGNGNDGEASFSDVDQNNDNKVRVGGVANGTNTTGGATTSLNDNHQTADSTTSVNEEATQNFALSVPQQQQQELPIPSPQFPHWGRNCVNTTDMPVTTINLGIREDAQNLQNRQVDHGIAAIGHGSNNNHNDNNIDPSLLFWGQQDQTTSFNDGSCNSQQQQAFLASFSLWSPLLYSYANFLEQQVESNAKDQIMMAMQQQMQQQSINVAAGPSCINTTSAPSFSAQHAPMNLHSDDFERYYFGEDDDDNEAEISAHAQNTCPGNNGDPPPPPAPCFYNKAHNPNTSCNDEWCAVAVQNEDRGASSGNDGSGPPLEEHHISPNMPAIGYATFPSTSSGPALVKDSAASAASFQPPFAVNGPKRTNDEGKNCCKSFAPETSMVPTMDAYNAVGVVNSTPETFLQSNGDGRGMVPPLLEGAPFGYCCQEQKKEIRPTISKDMTAPPAADQLAMHQPKPPPPQQQQQQQNQQNNEHNQQQPSAALFWNESEILTYFLFNGETFRNGDDACFPPGNTHKE
ncbi:hypothetical protein ACA910_019758 [Epithemia clementina (nom. ined.)]